MELAQPAQALRPIPNPGGSISELWPLFVLLAALLLPIDVGVRRLAIPLVELIAKALAGLRSKREAVTAQAEVVDRLQQAKQRARTTTEPSPSPAERPIVTSQTEKRPAPVARPAKASGSSAGTSLLEAKRKRQSGDEEN